MQRSWQQVVLVISSPACQEFLQSGVTDPTFPQPRHNSIGTEPSACSLSIISSKNSMHHDRLLGQYLIPTQLGSLNRDTTSKICNAYFNDFSDREVFDTEILRWKKRWALAEGEKPNSLVDTLSSISEDLPECRHCAHHSPSRASVDCDTKEIIQHHEKSENIHAIYYAYKAAIVPCCYARIHRDAY